MAWFKFGKQDSAAEAPLETVEMMRTRAKRRLIGSLVLVVIAVVGFPLLFETQPRPALVDVPIEIPDKAKVKPLTAPAPSAPAAAAKVDDKSSLGGKEEIVSPTPAAPASAMAAAPASSLPAIAAPKIIEKPAITAINSAPSATKSVATTPAADSAAIDKAAAQKAAQDKAKADAAAKSKSEAAKAQALLDGKAATASAPVQAAANTNGERFIVQFGSFADEAKAREVRQRVERAGLKTYAQIAETAEGKRHRVRVGPFASRAEAEKAATKIKSLDLPANILTL